MNWKLVRKGYIYLMSLILIPCSWALIIGGSVIIFHEAGLLSIFVLVIFTIIHFVFNYHLD